MAFRAKPWTVSWRYTYSYTPEWPESPPEAPQPWRGHHKAPDTRLWPLWLVERFVDWSRVSQIQAQDQDRLALLKEDVAAKGLEEPLEFVYDANGNARLRNGYHRFVVCSELGYSYLPVWCRLSTGKIQVKSVKLVDALPEFVRASTTE